MNEAKVCYRNASEGCGDTVSDKLMSEASIVKIIYYFCRYPTPVMHATKPLITDQQG